MAGLLKKSIVELKILNNTPSSSDDLNEFNQLLLEEEINYFSYTLFNKGIPIFSACSDTVWMDFYKTNYLPKPPVQEHILRKRFGAIDWNQDIYDLKTSKYLKLRCDVVGCKSIWTVLVDKGQKRGAISFGCKYDKTHIINFLNDHRESIKKVCGHLFNLF